MSVTTAALAVSLILLLGLSPQHVVPTDEGKRSGELTIKTSNLLGGTVGPARVTIKSADSKVVFSGVVEDDFTVSLPYGDYLIQLVPDFAGPLERRFTLKQPSAFLVMASSFEGIDAAPLPVTVALRVRPASSCRTAGHLWAKLIAVYSNYQSESRIGKLGYAAFEGIDIGTYVIVVVDGKQLRGVGSLTTTGPVTTAEIALEPCQ